MSQISDFRLPRACQKSLSKEPKEPKKSLKEPEEEPSLRTLHRGKPSEGRVEATFLRLSNRASFLSIKIVLRDDAVYLERTSFLFPADLAYRYSLRVSKGQQRSCKIKNVRSRL
jgi:hypothetical protein